VVITVCLAGNPNVRLSFIDLKYGLSFETCKQQFYMAAHSNVNLDKYALLLETYPSVCVKCER